MVCLKQMNGGNSLSLIVSFRQKKTDDGDIVDAEVACGGEKRDQSFGRSWKNFVGRMQGYQMEFVVHIVDDDEDKDQKKGKKRKKMRLRLSRKKLTCLLPRTLSSWLRKSWKPQSYSERRSGVELSLMEVRVY